MDRPLEKLPYKISEYIKEYFKEDFLCEVKTERVQGNVYYNLEVSKDGRIHNLLFNQKGDVLTDETEQAFPSDGHDELTLEGTPD